MVAHRGEREDVEERRPVSLKHPADAYLCDKKEGGVAFKPSATPDTY